jgi:hypothetical protein
MTSPEGGLYSAQEADRETAPMTSRLRIFVSAGPDLEIEKEVVGKAIAGLPLPVGWVIKYTPLPSEVPDPSMEAVAACDFYALLMAADVTAPMGAELHIARRAGKRILAFLREGPRTPAAYVFIRRLPEEWLRFSGERELRRLFQRTLVDQILERPEGYGLSLPDWEALSDLSSELADESLQDEEQDITPRHGGAGSDAVIVAPGRDLPSEGVLIGRRQDPS